MSRIPNRTGLPQSLVDAVTYSDRNREGCDYTITELLTPPRILALQRQHEDKITEDASDRLWSLLGQAGHEVLKRYGKQGGKAIVEERAVIEATCGSKSYKIGGQLDYLVTESHELTDFKFTSVWAIKSGLKPEWEQQLNLYRWLAWHYGIAVERVRIVAIARDWSVREARRDAEYPQQQAQVFEVPLWSWAECERFTCERIAMHETARIALPECSSDEMWEKPEKWAVTKRGNKRATRVLSSKGEAIEFAQGMGAGTAFEIQQRPAERPRCESYCACAPFCLQYLAWISKEATNGK